MSANQRPDLPGSLRPPPPPRAGFTLVEVIVAVVILAYGLLGMAGTTLVVVRQVTLAHLATERCAAIQSAIERLRALPFEDVISSSDSVGIFFVECSVTSTTAHSKTIRVVTTGPGMSTDGAGFPLLTSEVADTVTYRIIGP